jgi:lambda family phage portal protein
MKFFGREFFRETTRPALPTVTLDQLPSASFFGDYARTIYDGEKFPGGFGLTEIQTPDYWLLRTRSAQLFTSNLYAAGLIRRLITNEINTGLTPEASPDEAILGLAPDSLNDWTENVENRFGLWAKNKTRCDVRGLSTFGELQRDARREALIEGDVLAVIRSSPADGMPMLQFIRGNRVRTPYDPNGSQIAPGARVYEGVEVDADGRHVAFWVLQDDGSYKRLPAFGPITGRPTAWLCYGVGKRYGDHRGMPLLALVLQSLREVDRYRDSAQRKAVINSMLAMFIKKSQDKMGTLPVTGGATRRDKIEAVGADGAARKYDLAGQIPGVVFQELQVGEEPVGFSSQGTDVNFGTFEAAIIQAVAWANEIPPEILTLAFSNNYSASQAAINEFKIYLNLVWSSFGENVCQPVYTDWLLSATLAGTIAAPGLLEAYRDPAQGDKFGAWISADWYGSIKPSTDTLKQARGSQLLVSEGWSTNAREARITTGTKFSKNIKRLKRENELKAEALRPLAEFNREFGITPAPGATEPAMTAEPMDELDERGAPVVQLHPRTA